MDEIVLEIDAENAWIDKLKGKTLTYIRPHFEDKTPRVVLHFNDETWYEVSTKPGVFFEGCLVNTLRKAQPIADVVCVRDNVDTYMEVSAGSFPLFILLAQNKQRPADDFPFELKEMAHG